MGTKREKHTDRELELMFGGVIKLMRVMFAIIKEVNAAGGTARSIDWLDRQEGETIIRQLAKIIVDAGRRADEFGQLLAACKQYWVNPRIRVDVFPLVDDGTRGEVEEYCFHPSKKGVEAESELAKLGFMPVGMKRGMEHLVAHPGHQDGYPIAILGAKRWDPKTRRVEFPYFRNGVHGHYFDLRGVEEGLDPECHILVCRIPNQQGGEDETERARRLAG